MSITLEETITQWINWEETETVYIELSSQERVEVRPGDELLVESYPESGKISAIIAHKKRRYN